MADAKPTKIGLDAAVALEVAAAPVATEVDATVDLFPSDERRVVGVAEFKAPDGSMIVVTNL